VRNHSKKLVGPEAAHAHERRRIARGIIDTAYSFPLCISALGVQQSIRLLLLLFVDRRNINEYGRMRTMPDAPSFGGVSAASNRFSAV